LIKRNRRFWQQNIKNIKKDIKCIWQSDKKGNSKYNNRINTNLGKCVFKSLCPMFQLTRAVCQTCMSHTLACPISSPGITMILTFLATDSLHNTGSSTDHNNHPIKFDQCKTKHSLIIDQKQNGLPSYQSDR